MSEILVNKDLPYRDIALVANSNPEDKDLPVNYAVMCDAPIVEAAAYMPRTIAALSMSASLSEDRKTFYFSWHPSLRQKAIYVQVFSREDIHIVRITPVP